MDTATPKEPNTVFDFSLICDPLEARLLIFYLIICRRRDHSKLAPNKRTNLNTQNETFEKH